MSEHRRKTLRSFYCEESLWQAFEKRSRELDTTIDQLINDALRQYLQGPAEPAYSAPAPAAPAPAPRAMAPAPAPAPAAVEHPTYAMPSVPRKMPPRPTGQMAPPPPPSGPAVMAPPPAPSAPPPRAGQTGAVPAMRAGAMPPLFVHFAGRSYPVNKDRFIIGRGSQGTDLTIRDGNISRKHAAVIFHSGAFYMQDLGSTNGVEYSGNKIESKKIEEGDAYYICDHELTFSYRG
jgi:hypothetical protein